MMPTLLQALKHNSRSLCLAAAVLLGGCLTGCATGPNAHPRDPLEPLNRGVYRFNDAVDKAVLKPTATAYTKVTPTFVQKGVRNFFSNLGDAWSTVNSILQLRGQDAANSFSRLTVNTVFGLGGIFDVATEARIPQSKQDFGLTLGRWGVPSGPYVVLPLLGPSTLRDTAALPIDMKGNPVGAVDTVGVRNGLSILSVVDYRAQMLQASDLLDQAALDPYTLLRDAYLQQRDARAGQTGRAVAGQAAGQAASEDGYEPPLQDDGAAPDANAHAAGAGYEPPLADETNTGQAGTAAATAPAQPQSLTQPANQSAEQSTTQEAEPVSGQGVAQPVPTTPATAPAATVPASAEPAKPGREAAATLRGSEGPESTQPPAVPAVSGQTPHYWPVVPKWVDEVAPNSMGGSFWRR